MKGKEIKVTHGATKPLMRPHKNRKYPFSTMNVGDSFNYDISKRASVCVASIMFSKKYKQGKWKFSVNAISETEVMVIRKK